MLKEELVSIIVPVYNVEKYLSQCIDSILSQTYICFELILVDDGSTDSSSRICDEYVLKDTRIKVIHKKNGGLSSERNKVIEICKGNYIFFYILKKSYIVIDAKWVICFLLGHD